MSGSRLLIAIEVLDFLRTLRRREQQDLLRRFREVAAFPSNFSDLSSTIPLAGALAYTFSADLRSSSGTTSLIVM